MKPLNLMSIEVLKVTSNPNPRLGMRREIEWVEFKEMAKLVRLFVLSLIIACV